MPTIKDVAKLCGVSAATVSYVLNNGPRTVRPQTRDRVLQAIEQLNYYPNAVARGLQRKRMDTFGVVLPQSGLSPLGNPYFFPILDGIFEAAMRHHQNTTLFTGTLWLNAQTSLPAYCDGRCDGLLLFAPPMHSDIVPALMAKGVPFVLIGDNGERPDVTSVDVDNVAAAREMTNHLLDHGHRRIALLGGGEHIRSTTQRLLGYRQALEARGISFDESLVSSGGYNQKSGYERGLILRQLRSAARPTALFCGNDLIALGVLKAFAEIGLRVPEEISIVGFDDVDAAAQTEPPLTTVRQPLRLVGERATELLYALIHENAEPGQKELLPTELVIRHSVGAPYPSPSPTVWERRLVG